MCGVEAAGPWRKFHGQAACQPAPQAAGRPRRPHGPGSSVPLERGLSPPQLQLSPTGNKDRSPCLQSRAPEA